MPFRLLTSCLLCMALLFISACTETVIREVPADASDNVSSVEPGLPDMAESEPVATQGLFGSPTPAAPASTLFVESPPETGTDTPQAVTSNANPGPTAQTTPPSTTAIPDAPTGTAGTAAQAGADSNAAPSASFADQGALVVAGTPGVTVDCQLMLPCRWSSSDAALTVTATSADNIAARERLSVSFTIDTTHDTSLSLGSSPAATGEDSANYTVTEQSLGASNGNSPQALLAGASLRGRLNYNAAARTTMSTWSLALFDNGFARNAMFSNLPVGAAINADADCADTLPCTWTTSSGDVTVTLVSAGGFTGSGRLSAGFSIMSTRDRTLAIDGASTAVGSDGSTFTSRTHQLARQSGYQKLTQITAAGTSVPGSVDFFRSESQPDALGTLMLSVFDDEPSPRWNPVFLNVPVL